MATAFEGTDMQDSVADLYFDLPEDPGAKFIIFEGMMSEILASAKNNSGWDAERSYMESMFAFSEVFGDGLLEMDEPPIDNDEFASYYYLYASRIRTAVTKVKLRNTAGLRMEADRIVILNNESKDAIRQLLGSIREQLDGLNLSDDKRRQLIRKLQAFAAELDQQLTEALFAFAAQAAKAARDVGAEFKPLAERLDRILDMIDKAEKWVDSLPKWRDRKQVEGPQKKLPAPPDASDDIPF
jgi:hypothetical protein